MNYFWYRMYRKTASWMLLVLMGFFVSGIALAEDFGWKVGFNDDAIYATPQEACDATLIYTIQTRPDLWRLQGPATIRWASNAKYYCAAIYGVHYPSGGFGFGSTVRVGSSCKEDFKYNSTSGVCEPLLIPPPRKQVGVMPNVCPSGFAGNPVNFAVGNKFQHEIDYNASAEGAQSFMSFSRSYNSVKGYWSNNYSSSLAIRTNEIGVNFADGRQSLFSLFNDVATPEASEHGVLVKVGDERAASSPYWRYTSPLNEVLTFNYLGMLIRIEVPGAPTQNLSYYNPKVFVTDDFGNKLEFTADGQGQPKSLKAPGLEIKYRYSRLGRLDSVEAVRVSGQTETRLYHYEDARDQKLLTGITDERGIRYATWTYDDQGRAISSEHADGADKVSISYNADDSSTVTSELGKKTIYRFQTIQGIKRITAIEGEPSPNCPNSNSSFTYDERGLLKTKTDNKGHLTTFDYNERGLEVSRTEAAGTPQARTIATAWNPEFFSPVTVTEPDRITQYTYDDQGRQLSQTVTQR